MSGAERAARAIAIRDHLLPLIRAHGVMQEVGASGLRMVMWKAGRFAFALRSPFNPLPNTAPASFRAALAKQRAGPVLPWGLDVWHGYKVLSLQWDDTGRAEVTGFIYGPWEDEALALGGPDPSPGA